MANGGAGLRIIDVSNPASPQEVGFYDRGSSTNGVYVSGDYVYVVEKSGGLRIIDISNPAVLQEVGFYDTGEIAYSVYVAGNYAYVAAGSDGLRIIDVVNPASPKEVGFYDTGDSAMDVWISDNCVYVADGEDGLYILRNDLILGIDDDEREIPSEVALSQNYPNPFNPTTIIKFAVFQPGRVKLEIYSIEGKQVNVLINNHLNSGQYSVTWNGSDYSGKHLASGIYFFRFVAGDYRKVKKAILVK